MQSQSKYIKNYKNTQLVFEEILNIMVTKTGYSLAYTVTKASIHDINMVETLSYEYATRKLLGDKGYISSSLQEKLAKRHIILSTPVRKNSKTQKKVDDHLLSGFESRFECLLLVFC